MKPIVPKDPLPVLVDLSEMVEVTHANDRLAKMALDQAIAGLSKGYSSHYVVTSLRNTRDFLVECEREEAAAVLGLAIEALLK